MDISLREALSFIVFALMWFFVPILVEHMAQRHRIRFVGQELVALIIPPMACLGVYQKSWELLGFSLSAGIGLYVGLWHAHKKYPQSDAIGALLLGLASSAISAVITLGFIAWRWTESA